VFTVKLHNEILAKAKKLTPDFEPSEIDEIILAAASLSVMHKRRIYTAVKENAGIPLSVIKEAEQAERPEPLDHLQLAQQLMEKIGAPNVLADDGFVWRWLKTGVWKAQDDRSVKQWVQRFIEGKAKSINKSCVESISDLFKTEVYSPDVEFNIGPPECVNTPNGELMLSDGEWTLTPHNREHYRTTQIPVEYDRDAQAPRFIQFLSEIFGEDPDAADKAMALLEMMGYTLMAHCRHERFIILVGSGANGKSVLLSVLEALTGHENTAGVQPSQFGRSFQRAHLHGKLANIVTEIKQGEVIDDASLKGIVSGEPTTVEHKFQTPFTMRPFATCWFGTNHMPHTRDFSDALFRRALVVEFNNTFKPELGNCDPNLKDDLMTELPGILALSLASYADALSNGFTLPNSCRQAREKWRLEADQVAQFVESECDRQEGAKMEPQEVFNLYRDWAAANGIHKQLTQRSFIDRLVRLGFERGKSNGRRVIKEIARTAMFDR
jgi:putative DNA primase/helicase